MFAMATASLRKEGGAAESGSPGNYYDQGFEHGTPSLTLHAEEESCRIICQRYLNIFKYISNIEQCEEQ